MPSPLTITLGAMLLVAILGSSIFAPFEVETPAARKIAKWLIVSTLAAALSFVIGYRAALVPAALGVLGMAFHFGWCVKNGIHPLQATPRRRYYELRGWPWPE